MHMLAHSAFHPSPPSMLDRLHDEFPLLAGAAAGHRPGADRQRLAIGPLTRLLATVAAFAAAGERMQLKIHAARALDAGAGQDALKEIVYLTAAKAGLARAVDSAQALSELFAERWERGEPIG